METRAIRWLRRDMLFWYLGIPWILSETPNLPLSEEEQARIPMDAVLEFRTFYRQRDRTNRAIMRFPRTRLSEALPPVSLVFLTQLQIPPAA